MLDRNGWTYEGHHAFRAYVTVQDCQWSRETSVSAPYSLLTLVHSPTRSGRQTTAAIDLKLSQSTTGHRVLLRRLAGGYDTQ